MLNTHLWIYWFHSRVEIMPICLFSKFLFLSCGLGLLYISFLVSQYYIWIKLMSSFWSWENTQVAFGNTLYHNDGKNNKHNLVNNQEVLRLIIVFFILMTIMFDSGMMLKGEIRCPSVLGIKGSKDNDITYIPSWSWTPKTSVN